MQLLSASLLKFTRPDWRRDSELALIDTILEQHPHLLSIIAPDVMGSDAVDKPFGRKDSPSVEQVMRAAIFKELKGLTYRELEYAQTMRPRQIQGYVVFLLNSMSANPLASSYGKNTFPGLRPKTYTVYL